MYIHYFLKTVHESCKAKRKKGTVCSQILSNWLDQPAKKFYYNIAGQNFTLEDIKHGLLRSNKPKPGSFFKHVKTSDQRLYFLPQKMQGEIDPRINFVCRDYPQFVDMIEVFNGSTSDQLNETLDNFCSDEVNSKVTIDLISEGFTLPAVMQQYRSDFGGTDRTLLEFIYNYLKDDNGINFKTACQRLNSG